MDGHRVFGDTACDILIHLHHWTYERLVKLRGGDSEDDYVMMMTMLLLLLLLMMMMMMTTTMAMVGIGEIQWERYSTSVNRR